MTCFGYVHVDMKGLVLVYDCLELHVGVSHRGERASVRKKSDQIKI